MKTTLLLASALCLLAACNFTKTQTEQPKAAFITHKEAADTMRLATVDSSQVDSLTMLIEYGYIEPEKAKALLSELDIQALMGSDEYRAHNGFFGQDNYRIEFYIKKARLNPADSLTIWLEGKCRYKKNVTDFTGSIKVDSVFGYQDLSYNYQEYLEYEADDTSRHFEGDTFTGTYHLKGTFALNENSKAYGAGVYSGNFYMDFAPYRKYQYEEGEDPNGYQLWYNTNNETRRGGFLFDGNWAGNKTGEAKPVLVAADLFMFANDILENFSYGEREIEINPKYRALGWDRYWDGEEWWNEAGDTKLLKIYLP